MSQVNRNSEYESYNEVKESSECDSENNSTSECDSEFGSGNEAKRRKVSESDREHDSESGSQNDSEYDSEHEIGSESTGADLSDEILQTDKDGHIICHASQKIGDYEFKSVLGEGAFGRVLRVRNCVTGQNAALKVIKNDPAKQRSAMKEITALATISSRDPNAESLCVPMLDWFNYSMHICIVFPLLGSSVFDFLKSNNFEPFSTQDIRHIGYQLCTAVAFLHRNGMTHTDLKPENIVFVNSSYTTSYDSENQLVVRHPVCTRIRLIDFGLATRDHDFHYPVITTRFYRAPEVILRLGWTHTCDIWAVACILFEIYFGDLLFLTHDDREHLAIMEKIIGPMELANSTERSFFKNGIFDWDWNEADEDTRNYCSPLKDFQNGDSADDNEIFDVIRKMLKIEPTKRLSMSEALAQPFFKKLPEYLRT